MAIKHLWTFGHMSGVTTANATGGGLASANIPLALKQWSNSVGTGGFTSTGRYALYPGYYAPGGAYASPFLSLLNSAVMDWTTPRSFFGFRYQGIVGLGGSVLILSTDTGSGSLKILAESDFSFAINTDYWIECCIDRVANTITAWVDSVLIKTISFDPAKFLTSSTLYFGVAQAYVGPSTWVRWYSDFYFLDDTQDNTKCNRLGPMQIVALPVSSVNAPGWSTTNSDTIPNVLNAMLSGTPPADTPGAVPPANQTPLVANFGSGNVASYAAVVATEYRVAAKRDTITTTSLKTALGLSGNTQNGSSLSFPSSNTTVFSQRALIAEKAPDGSSWNQSNVAQATLTLTPSS